MPSIQFTALPTEAVRALQTGGPDANGQPPERVLAAGTGNPCRHCLRLIAEGAPMLILAHRPFPAPQTRARKAVPQGMIALEKSLRRLLPNSDRSSVPSPRQVRETRPSSRPR